MLTLAPASGLPLSARVMTPVMLPGVLAQHLQGGGADAPLGGGRGADEGGIVVLVGEKAQVTGEILDFRLVEKRLAAGEAVGNLGVAQLLLEDPCQMVGAVKDGVVAETAPVLETVGLELHHYALRFALVVAAGGDGNGLPVAQFRPQGFLEQLFVMGDDGVGRLEDAHRGAVVLLQLDDPQGRELVRQALQVGDVRPPPGVDGLVVVPHGGELGADAGEQLQELVLTGIGVLVLIHQQIAQAVLPLFAHFGVALQDLHRP